MTNTNQHLKVSADFPGGNILIDRIDSGIIEVHQDLRDTEGDWFYWYFEVEGKPGDSFRVRFTGSDVFGPLGPAASVDGGLTWQWLGMECVDRQSFDYSLPEGIDRVRFSLAMPYTAANFETFLSQYRDHFALERSVLCRSRQGREVELLRAGCLSASPRYRILLTARHHCCEMMASYELEGILAAILADDALGQWYRETVEVLVVPFVDKDGVENGDHGKNRRPHDHNRDYKVGIYPEVRAIQAIVGELGPGSIDIALDLHCPWIRGSRNESIYFVGGTNQIIWAEVNHLSLALEHCRSGTLPFSAEDNLPFGVDWNTGDGLEEMSFSGWASGLAGIKIATSLELPYANAGGAEVNPESARSFGRDVAAALAEYLKQP